MAKTQAKAGYSAKDITVLEGLEPVRLRPGMYIGSTGLRGLHHLVEEIVVNSVDEALAGYNDSIEITIHPDNSVTVRDRGRGIPVDVVEGTGTSALEVIMTKLHAGGKFGGDGYKVSGGLHGVGASVVNALSEWLVVEVSRDSKVYRQEFDRGVPRGPMQIVGESTENGTTTTFLADADIFDETVYDATTIVSRFREMAFLTRGLRITFTDERAGAEPPVEFHYEGGIKDLRLLHQRVEGRGASARRLLLDRQRPGRGRGRDAVEHVVPGVGLLLRQQRQHPRGRLAPLRLSVGAHVDDQQVRPRQGPA